MWLFTQTGFVSAVHKDGALQLRARDRESLIRLGFKASEIKTGQGTDYPFRAYTDHETFAAIVAKQVAEIDYDNFKNVIKKKRGERFASALNDVWFAMLRVEPKDAISKLNNSSWRRPRKPKGATVVLEEDRRWYDDLLPEPTDADLRDLPLHMLTDDEWAQLEKDGWV